MQICNTESSKRSSKIEIGRSYTDNSRVNRNPRVLYQHRPQQEEIDFHLPLQPQEDVSVRDPTIITNDRYKMIYSQQFIPSPQQSIESKKIEWSDQVFSLSNIQSSRNTTKKLETHKHNKHSPTQIVKFFSKKMLNIIRPPQIHKVRQILKDKSDYDQPFVFDYLQYWNQLYLIVLSIMHIITPFRIAIQYYNFKQFDYCLTSLFFIEILLNFNKAYYHNGYKVKNRNQIIKHYIQTNFIKDLIAFLFIFLIQLNSFQQPYLIASSFIFLFASFQKFTPSKYLALVTFFIHNLTCLNIFLTQDSSDHYFNQYNQALLNTFALLRGSIYQEPTSQPQILFSNFCLIIPCTILLYIIIQLQVPEIKFENQKLNNKLLSSINNYIKNHQKQVLQTQQQSQLTKMLPESLQQQIQARLKKLIIEKCSVLKQFSMIKEMTLEVEIFESEQQILSKSSLDEGNLYIIDEGEVLLENEIENQYFGEYGFFTGFSNNIDVTSNCYTKVYKLAREDFIKKLYGNPSEYERYCYIKDKLLYCNEPTIITNRNCIHCNDNSHFTRNCSLIHYIPNREKVIKQYEYSIPSRRNKDFTRTSVKRKNTKSYQKQLNERQMQMQQNLTSADQSSLKDFSKEVLPYEEMVIRDSYSSAQSLTKLSKQMRSNYEQNSFPNAQDGLFFSEFDQLSRVDAKSQDNQFFNLTRTNDQKNTFATAGFGQQSMKQSQKHEDMVIIPESDEQMSIRQDSIEDFDKGRESMRENVRENPKQSPQKRRKNEPKLTFNFDQEFENQQFQQEQQPSRQNSVQLSSRQGSVRQNSNRSQTYTPILSQYSQNPSNVSHKSFSKIYQSSSSQIRKKPMPQQQEEVSNYQRENSRKRSTHTKVSINCSNFHVLSGLEVRMFKNEYLNKRIHYMQTKRFRFNWIK